MRATSPAAPIPASDVPSLSFHGGSHHAENPDRIAQYSKLNQYHVKCLAYYLDKLKNTPDGDGTLLDHSLVLYGTNMGDSNQHLHYDVPHLLAGGGSGSSRADGIWHFPTQDRHVEQSPAQHSFGCTAFTRTASATARVPWRASFDVGQPFQAADPLSSGLSDEVRYPLTLPLLTAAAALLFSLTASAATAPSPVADAAMKGDMATVKTLLAQKADVNAPQADGATALQWAAYENNLALADVLIKGGRERKARQSRWRDADVSGGDQRQCGDAREASRRPARTPTSASRTAKRRSCWRRATATWTRSRF